MELCPQSKYYTHLKVLNKKDYTIRIRVSPPNVLIAVMPQNSKQEDPSKLYPTQNRNEKELIKIKIKIRQSGKSAIETPGSSTVYPSSLFLVARWDAWSVPGSYVSCRVCLR